MSSAKSNITKKKKSTKNQHQIPLLPLRDLVTFPHMNLSFFVGRDQSIDAIDYAIKNKTPILLCAQKQGDIDNPTEEEIFQMGTLATITQVIKLQDGTLKVMAEGQKRAHILNYIKEKPFFLVEIEELSLPISNSLENQALVRSAKDSFENYIRLNKRIPPETLVPVQKTDSPGLLADIIATHINLKLEERQALLELVDEQLRLQQVFELLENELDIIKMEKRIKGRVRKQMEKGQREYYLNEQMAAIQQELGDRDEFKNEILELEKKILDAKMSDEATDKANSELKKLKSMAPMSPESTVIRNYLDTIIELPWNKRTKDNLDLENAKKVLDQDHFGLDKIKDRILEYLAVQHLSHSKISPIICFVGPPGVGKTSLGATIAKAIERKYARIALGGLKDESEIRGHRKTYIGAMPGKIINSIKKAKSKNPLIVLDEIDKMGSEYRGDPSSAMLEVLDPEQNCTFNDHYLEVDFDLSEVLFIATANNLQTIPRPLLDRMEIIELSSYLEIEKKEIAKRHLIPKKIEAIGLNSQEIEISDDAIEEIIRYYTCEAGVRNLDRVLAKIFRKCAKKIVEQKQQLKEIKINKKDLEKILGPRIFSSSSIEKENKVGITNGLCWTSVGGDTLAIEVSIVHGQGKITITGKLGDVMQESAQTAYSYIRSRAEQLDLPKNFYKNLDVHIHVPEGATPKDGPSAGIAIATSVASALTNRLVDQTIAMTGEITLRGNVLPVGGIREKLIAAHRAGIKKVIIPEENAKDLYEIPDPVLKELSITAVKSVDEVLRLALVFHEKDPLEKELGNPKKAIDNIYLLKKKKEFAIYSSQSH